MKSHLISLLLCLCILCSIGPAAHSEKDKFSATTSSNFYSSSSGNHEQVWKNIDSLISVGQYKSAHQQVLIIYKRLKNTDATEDLLKAVLYKLFLADRFKEEAGENNLEWIQKEIASAAFPVNAVMHNMLAELYFWYYKNNEYVISESSVIKGNAGETDVESWDAALFEQKIRMHYDASLAQEVELQKINIGKLDAILIKGSPDSTHTFRPTLFDFLAYRALDYYRAEQSRLPVPFEHFTIDNKELFGATEEFIKTPVLTTDTNHFDYKALLIYKSLLKFHHKDNNPAALIDADLQRLSFVYEKYKGADKDTLYLKSLKALRAQFQNVADVTLVDFHLAEYWMNNSEPFDPRRTPEIKRYRIYALENCDAAINSFPASIGAMRCRHLRDQLLQKSLSFAMEEVNEPGKPFRVLLDYRNLDRIWLRIIEDPTKRNDAREYDPKGTIKLFTAAKGIQEWELRLPEDKDLRNHSVEIPAKALPSGRYVLLIADNPNFDTKQQAVAWSAFRVSRLSLISRQSTSGVHEFNVLDRTSGQPIAGVDVRVLMRNYNYSSKSYVETEIARLSSDSEGRFEVKADDKDHRSFNLELIHKEDRLYLEENFFKQSFGTNNQKAHIQTRFFTDRSIYRPGQTIYFKAILLEYNNALPRVAALKKTTISFYDANSKLLSTLDLMSDNFGSCHGSFVAPSGVLNGQMRIRNESGSRYIRVEEYKRPRFELVFDPVKGSYKLGDTIRVTATANLFAGAPVEQAKVVYRVYRTPRYPVWKMFWSRPFIQEAEQEIVQGITTTDENGKFSIRFITQAASGKSEELPANYDFKLVCYVTDAAGETQSGETTVVAGKYAAEISTSHSGRWILGSPDTLEIRASNMADEALNMEVNVEVYRLQAPERMLRKRQWGIPDKFIFSKEEFIRLFPNDVYEQEDDPALLKKEKLIWSGSVLTGKQFFLDINRLIKTPGHYVIECVAAGDEMLAEKFVQHLEIIKNTEGPAIEHNPELFIALNDRVLPGQNARFIIGSDYKQVNMLLLIEQNGRIFHKEWIKLDRRQKIWEFPVSEEMRGNIHVHYCFVKNSRIYNNSTAITVPWNNKELDITVETFRDKLKPGNAEEWRLRIRNKAGEIVLAQGLASMYDASLDVFLPHVWDTKIFPGYSSGISIAAHTFGLRYSNLVADDWNVFSDMPPFSYDRLKWFNNYYRRVYDDVFYSASPEADNMEVRSKASLGTSEHQVLAFTPPPPVPQEAASGATDVKSKSIQPRRLLEETAFFFSDLQTDSSGSLLIAFRSPESLTRWRFQFFASTKELESGYLEKEVLTQKELMVLPQLPRFIRSGDTISLSARIIRLTDTSLQGNAFLSIKDPLTGENLNQKFGVKESRKAVDLAHQKSADVNWTVSIPIWKHAVAIEISAGAGAFSDGEVQTIAVLSNRQLVTEVMPLWARGKESRTFEFKKLKENNSKTLEHFNLTLEYTKNPVWLAIQALPYMMEYPYACAEQVFARYYANALGYHLANSDPRIRNVFELWKKNSPETFRSALEKNQELKNVLLEETPWVMEAQSEAERKERLGLLFDINKMEQELSSALIKLEAMQTVNGAWPWFEGMPEDPYVSIHILSGLGHLNKLGIINKADLSKNMITRGVQYLDEFLEREYRQVLPAVKEKQSYNRSLILHALYARSFFPQHPLSGNAEKASVYFTKELEKSWTKLGLHQQGLLALHAHRRDEKKLAQIILASLADNALHSEEMGMYWKNNIQGWGWYEAPVETQALLIEVFSEIGKDVKAVEAMKTWLIKQKQTHAWKSTKASAEACYALLLQGKSWLDQGADMEIFAGGRALIAGNNLREEAGTGTFRKIWQASEIRPELATVSIQPGTRAEEGASGWGAMYWQYFEDIDKVTASASAIPLKIQREFYKEENTDRGPVIIKISDSLQLEKGDRILVRLLLQADRDMSYVHLKDYRASGTEPIEVLSTYRWKNGLGYYETMRDAAANFFISYLPKGKYVFEYRLKAEQSGNFSAGRASIQNMYAPEFTAHSEGVRILIK